MDYNKIGDSPLGLGYGQIWQGSAVDATLLTLPGPLVVITMDAGELDESYIDHVKSCAIAEIYIGIEDSPGAVLPDLDYKAHLYAGQSYLMHGLNLYIHCAAGVSRASYYNIGFHMLLHGWDFDTAFAYIKKYRPVADPNSGFVEYLKGLKF